MNIWLMLLVCFALMCQASATIVTFDDITTEPEAQIPDNYQGFHWDVFYVLDPSTYEKQSGYPNGLVSGGYVAWSDGHADEGNGASIAVIGGDSFDFIGVYLTAAWLDGLNVTIEGYRDDALLYNQTVVIAPFVSTWIAPNFTNIDELRFSSFGGIPVPGFFSDGPHFVLDNFTFVPEPGTVFLLGLGGLALLRKRKIKGTESPFCTSY